MKKIFWIQSIEGINLWKTAANDASFTQIKENTVVNISNILDEKNNRDTFLNYIKWKSSVEDLNSVLDGLYKENKLMEL